MCAGVKLKCDPVGKAPETSRRGGVTIYYYSHLAFVVSNHHALRTQVQIQGQS